MSLLLVGLEGGRRFELILLLEEACFLEDPYGAILATPLFGQRDVRNFACDFVTPQAF